MHHYNIYVGTCSTEENGALFHGSFNAASGAISDLRIVKDSLPTVFLHTSKEQIFAVSNIGTHAYVSSYHLHTASPPHCLWRQELPGSGLAYIDISPRMDSLYGAFYTDGKISVSNIAESSPPLKEAQTFYYCGSGPNHTRQESSHPHSIVLSPDGRWALAADLGTDMLYVYSMQAQGLLSPVGEGVKCPPGAGPRYSVFSPDGTKVYLISELNSVLYLLDFDTQNGAIDLKAEYPLCPKGYLGECCAGDLHLSADGRFLYTVLRGPDLIAALHVERTTGLLTFLGYFSCHGRWCNSFSISPDGEFVACANYHSNHIAVLPRDAAGMLGDAVTIAAVASPMCVRFAFDF